MCWLVAISMFKNDFFCRKSKCTFNTPVGSNWLAPLAASQTIQLLPIGMFEWGLYGSESIWTCEDLVRHHKFWITSHNDKIHQYLTLFAQRNPYPYTLTPHHYTAFLTCQLLPMGTSNMLSFLNFWCISACWTCQLVVISTFNTCMKKNQTQIMFIWNTNQTCWGSFWIIFIKCTSKHILPFTWRHSASSFMRWL